MADVFVADEEPVIVPVTEAAVYEDTVERIVLEDEIIPTYEKPTVIYGAETPVASPISHTVVVEEEEIVMPETKANIYEDGRRSVLEDEARKHRTTIVDETIVEAPVVRSVFEAADDSRQITENYVREDALRDYDYIELDSVGESDREPVEQPVLIKRVNTTVIEDDKVVYQVTEEHREALPVVEDVVISDEPEKKPKSRVHISTIPTDLSGNVAREENMIPVIPTDSIKGVNRRDTELPIILPATEEGRKIMADYSELAAKKEESSLETALRQAQDLPVAPEISLDEANKPKEEAPAPAPAPAEEEPKSNVIVADSDMNLDFGEFDAPDEEPTPEPEIIPEPEEEPVEESVVEEPVVEEPVVEEPVVEEPVVEEPVVEEPVVEEPVVEEPAMPIMEEPEEVPVEEPEEEPEVTVPVIEEPVFTDAEHADELMTDEEAEEHIEVVEEVPGRERTGKMHAINLDTLCDSFEDGEEVTLEALKEKKLAPKNAGRVKILARGTMTKKLDIVADNFSLQAVKMITLAGGRAEQYK